MCLSSDPHPVGQGLAELCANLDREGILIIAKGRISFWRGARPWAPHIAIVLMDRRKEAVQAAQAGKSAATTRSYRGSENWGFETLTPTIYNRSIANIGG